MSKRNEWARTDQWAREHGIELTPGRVRGEQFDDKDVELEEISSLLGELLGCKAGTDDEILSFYREDDSYKLPDNTWHQALCRVANDPPGSCDCIRAEIEEMVKRLDKTP